MSVQHIAWALEQSTGSVTRKAVLLCLANRTNSDTGLCCPSINRVAQETELHRATVIRALSDLETAGLIQKVERYRENGANTSNEYRFPSLSVRPPLVAQSDPPSRVARPQEPELEPEVESTSLAAAPRARPRNPIWDTLTEVFGEPTTRSAQKVRGKVCSSLSAARASPEEIISRARRWPLHFDGATMTDLALEKHWDTLARQPLRRQ